MCMCVYKHSMLSPHYAKEWETKNDTGANLQ